MTALAGFFIWLLGLCVGSFLNVVVSRLPRGLSVSQPARSFCPSCNTTLAWFDNLPLLSWLLLRGRCRSCGVPISAQYPLVEAFTGLTFVLVFHLLVVQHAHSSLSALSWPADAPIVAAWLILAAAMMACSAMDIVSYMIDTRITDWTVALAIILLAAWPRADVLLSSAQSPIAAAGVGAFAATLVMLWLTVWRIPAGPAEARDESVTPADAAAPADTPAKASPENRFAIPAIAAVLIGALSVLLAVGASVVPFTGYIIPAAFLALFAGMTLAGGHSRDADQELHDAISEEAPHARATAMREFAWLIPIMIVAGIAWWLASGPGASAWSGWMQFQVGPFIPLAGAVHAIFGAVVGAALGWTIRILFTLAFGQEAFGVGDIYILAAAGAAGGWDIAVLGFLLAVAIALAGWILGLLLKQTVMIPFGPPLAIGFLAALWLHRPATVFFAERVAPQLAGLQVAWEQQPHVVLLAGGFLFAGAILSVFVARLVRRLAEQGLKPPA